VRKAIWRRWRRIVPFLRGAFSAGGGVEVDTQGAAFLYAFDDPAHAVAAAAHGQHALENGPVRVRITVEAQRTNHTSKGRQGEQLAAAPPACAAGSQRALSQVSARVVSCGVLYRMASHAVKTRPRCAYLVTVQSGCR
jgi:hypothetical protein